MINIIREDHHAIILKKSDTALESEVVFKQAVRDHDKGFRLRKQHSTLVPEVPLESRILYCCHRAVHFWINYDASPEAGIIFEGAIKKVSMSILAYVKQPIIPACVIPDQKSFEC
jgi:hypothetical protein